MGRFSVGIDGCDVDIESCNRTTVISIRGDLCDDTASWARVWLATELLRSTDRLVIDLGGVNLLSAAGVTLLVGVHRGAAEAGISLQLRRPQPQVRWVLDICGLGPTVDDDTCSAPATAIRLPSATGGFRPATTAACPSGPPC